MVDVINTKKLERGALQYGRFKGAIVARTRKDRGMNRTKSGKYELIYKKKYLLKKNTSS